LKIHKLTIHRLTADLHCGCKVSSEYRDGLYKEVETAPKFTSCTEHCGDLETKIISMMLREFLEAEAEKIASAPVTRTSAPGMAGLPLEGNPLSTPIRLPSSKVRVGSQSRGDDDIPRPKPLARAAAAVAGNSKLAGLSVASPMQIDEVEADPRVDSALENVLGDLVDGDEEDCSR
jgi:hypothetical protein